MVQKIVRLLEAAAASAVLHGATAATAVTISTSGVTHVQVGSGFYDVPFVGGSCATVFDRCDRPTDLDFSTFAAADAAMGSLRVILNDASK